MKRSGKQWTPEETTLLRGINKSKGSISMQLKNFAARYNRTFKAVSNRYYRFKRTQENFSVQSVQKEPTKKFIQRDNTITPITIQGMEISVPGNSIIIDGVEFSW